MKWLTSAAVAVMATTAWAQVMPTGAGRALDANNLLGGGGWNSVRLAEPLFGPNNIGGQYRGNDFPRNPPSAIDNFVRDSLGMPRVMASQSTYSYLNRSSTLLPPSAFALGMNAPGSATPTTYAPSAPVQQLYDQALKTYQSSQATAVWSLQSPQTSSTDYTRTVRPTSDALRPPSSTLFGLMPQQEQEKLTADLAGITDLSKTARMDYQWDMNREAADRANADRTKTDANQPPDPSARTKQPQARDSANLDKNRLPLPGQDVFVDVMLLMQKNAAGQKVGPPQPEQMAGMRDVPSQEQAQPAKPAPRKEESDDRPRPQDVQRAAAAAAEADKKKAAVATEAIGGQVVIHRLAGTGRDQLNRQLLQGQMALNQGEYYRAASYFDSAVNMGGGNPLGYLGGAIAMFGAQEPMSAAIRLHAAMHVFPPLMQTVVDVEGLLGPRVVSVRMRQLQAQMEQTKPQPSLLFLDAFLKANTADATAAADGAAKLLEISKDPVHQAYAHVLLRRVGREASTPADDKPADALPPSMAPTTQP